MMKTILLVITFFLLGVFYEKIKGGKRKKDLEKEILHFGYNEIPKRVSILDKKVNFQAQENQLSQAGRHRVENEQIAQAARRAARYNKFDDDDEGYESIHYDDKELVAVGSKFPSESTEKASKIEAVFFVDDGGYEEDDFFN